MAGGTCFVGAPQDLSNEVQIFARNASDFPIYDAQLWYLQDQGLRAPIGLRTIMPNDQKNVGKQGVRDAVGRAVLTFRDASGIRWIRMPDGVVAEQTAGADTERSILAISRHGAQLTPPADARPGN